MSTLQVLKRTLDDMSLATPGDPRLLRVFAAAGACGMLAFHVLTLLAHPGAYDPLWARLGLAAGFVLILLLSYGPLKNRYRLGLAMSSMIGVVCVWYVWSYYESGFDLDRGVSLFLIVLAVAAALPTAQNLVPFLVLIASTLSFTLLTVQETATGAVVILLRLVVFIIFVLLASRSRGRYLTRLERLSQVARHTHAAALLLGTDGKPEWVNEAATELMGPWIESLEQGGNPLLSEADQDRFDAFLSGLSRAQPFRQEVRLTDLLGGQRWLDLDVTPVLQGPGNRFSGHVVVGRDVTDQKAGEKELRRSEGRYRRLVERSPMPIIALRDRKVLYANQAAARLLRVTAPSLLAGRQFLDHVVEEDRELAKTWLEQVRDQEAGSRELAMRRLDGRGRVEVLLQASSVVFGGQEMIQLVLSDLTERKQVERAKDEFVSTVNHELRTPLTSLRGSLGLLDAGLFEEGGERARMLIDLALRNTERLTLLINDLLDMQKIEAGRADFRLEILDLTDLVRNAIEANQPFADRFRVGLRLVRSLTGGLVHADPHRLSQVLTNLLSNAAKFSPEGAAVDVYVDRITQGLRVTVVDHGPGVPESFRDQLFRKFSRADHAVTRQIPGTGLGLAISRAIVEEHRGTLNLDRHFQEGAAFFFVLPEAEQALGVAPAQDASSLSF